MNLKDLQKEIPCKWRVQSFSKNKPSAQCVAYIDARQVAEMLDEVVGIENWQVDYKDANGLLMAGIGIKIDNEWIWKWDTGSESNIEKDKGHVSDAFKRAGVQWGIGRFLYSMDIKYVDANEKKTQSNFPYVVDKQGNRVWDLTEFLNK
jgi:hypothetical protein